MTYSNTFIPNLFHNKTFLITGSTSGIGRQSALALSALGARLVLVGRSLPKLEELITNLTNPELHSLITTDLSDLSNVQSTFQDASSSIPPLDGIFHSAGQGLVKPSFLTTINDINQVVNPAYLSATVFLPILLRKRLVQPHSSIVLMSSVAAYRGTTCMSLYSSAKGAIEAFSKSLSVELAPKYIRVNTIVAGAVVTPLHESLTSMLPESSVDSYESKHLLGFGSPSDIVNSVIFLLSPASTWITGSSFAVDGGFNAF